MSWFLPHAGLHLATAHFRSLELGHRTRSVSVQCHLCAVSLFIPATSENFSVSATTASIRYLHSAPRNPGELNWTELNWTIFGWVTVPLTCGRLMFNVIHRLLRQRQLITQKHTKIQFEFVYRPCWWRLYRSSWLSTASAESEPRNVELCTSVHRWLTDLADWLIDWLIDWLVHSFIH